MQQELRTHWNPRLDLEAYVMDSFKVSFGQGPNISEYKLFRAFRV